MHKYFSRNFFIYSLLGGSFFIFLSLSIAKVQAITTPDWLAPTNLTVIQGADVPALPTSLNGNIDCIPDGPYDCVVTTAFGIFSSNNTVKLTNSAVYRPLISFVDNRQHSIAVPNSDTIINYTTEPPYGLYFYFTYNLHSSITSAPIPGSTDSQYQINRLYDGKLVDRTNHRLAADYASMSFSPNSRWMVVSEPNVAILRVNLQTFEVVPFATGFNYTIGLDPAAKTAITNDGRYAVVSSKTFGRFEVYDLNTCASTPDTINGPVSCQSRDLQSLMQQKVPGYISVGQARFVNNNTLRVYADYNNGSGHKIASFTINPTDVGVHQLDFLAMGESYISGEGAFSYQQGTDTNDNRCHISTVSYPLVASRDLNYNSFHSVACSGAKIDDIINTNDDYRSQASPRQIRQSRASQVPSIISNFQPGYLDQLDFVSTYQPKTIVLSIGGNDIGFSSIIKNCIQSASTCYSSYEDRLELVREINNKFSTLVNTYQTIKNQSPSDTRIYIAGYPQIVKAGGNCALNVHLNSEELIFANQLVEYLDTVIQQAASKAGVYYADMKDALNGHRLCEAQPGSVAMNGLTAGRDVPGFLHGPMGIESYHPNDFGHQLLENKLLSTTQNLRAVMTTANLTAVPPSETGLAILERPLSGRALNKTFYAENLAEDIVPHGSPSDISVSGLEYSLKPLANYRAEIHSSSLVLGNFTSNTSGNLSFQISVPNSVEPGFHSLHIYGLNLAGEAVDIYKSIYVASSAVDYDGDGILNINDACTFIAPSNIDYDQDGIDDACDGTIAEPPPPLPASQTPSTNQNPSTPSNNTTLPAPNSPTQNNDLSNTSFQNQNTVHTDQQFSNLIAAPLTSLIVKQAQYPEQKYYSISGLGTDNAGFNKEGRVLSTSLKKVPAYSTSKIVKTKNNNTLIISVASIGIIVTVFSKFPWLRKLF